MRGPKKTKRPSQTPLVLYERDLRKLRESISDHVLTLVTGYLMDELDYDEDKIVALWEGIARYSNAVEDHLITLNTVKEIIEKNTGIKMLGFTKGQKK